MGKLCVVGIGPGSYETMTLEAVKALEGCDVIVGYTAYVALVKDHFPHKEFLATPMRREVERCHLAFREAETGRTVAMICSGDAGVYGMAGLMEELAGEYPGVELSIIPGVSAVLSGAALLGAPLMHDFCVVSLSDLLTPWEKIETRLRCAAQGDFVVCLYNPSSRQRSGHLRRACDVMLEFKAPETVCGVCRNIGREGESRQVLTLAELRETQADMFSTVFVGNRETVALRGGMVTPRGYRHG